MQRNNKISNKDHQIFFAELDKFIITNSIFLNNMIKIYFVVLIFKKDVDRTTLMTYN